MLIKLIAQFNKKSKNILQDVFFNNKVGVYLPYTPWRCFISMVHIAVPKKSLQKGL